MAQNENKSSKKTFTGKVDKVVFHDMKSGRAIFSVIREDGKSCRLIGTIQNIEKGCDVTATGAWKKDEKYGWQFMADSIVIQTDEEQQLVDDGLMHASDFSNVLNKSIKAFRRIEGVCDYDVEEPEQRIVKIDGVLYSADMTQLIRVPAETTSFEIPGSITRIEVMAFKDCKNIVSITIPESVSYIGKNAFSDCEALTSITINCKRFEKKYFNSVFDGCMNLKEIIIGNDMDLIPASAFKNCYSLTNVKIGNGVKSIEDNAFYGCSKLEDIYLPSCLRKIGKSAFCGCRGLKSVHISDLRSWCNITFEDKCSTPLYYAENLLLNGEAVKEVTFPEDANEIGNYQFCGCSSLVKLEIPTSVTSIGEEAFAKCINLENILVPSSVHFIGKNAFYGCKNFVIDKELRVQWENVTFRKDKISVIVHIGDFGLLLDAELLGVSEAMNIGKEVLKTIMLELKVRMISKDKCEIVDSHLLKEAINADITKDIDWNDVQLGDGYINLPTPWGNRIYIRDDKIVSSLNGIRDYLRERIPTLKAHFSSFVNAEILNIDELYEIAIVLDIKNNLHSMVGNPKKLKELSQLLTKHSKVFAPRNRSTYIKYLFENHPFDTYPIVPIIEGEGKSAERGALFTIMKEEVPYIVWENFNDARATYIFPCTKEDYDDRRQLIFDFIMSVRENKRSYLRTNSCRRIFGTKPIMIVHNNIDTWIKKLVACESGHVHGNNYITNVEMTSLEDKELVEANYQGYSFNASATFEINYNKIVGDKEINLITCTFQASVSIQEYFDRYMSESDIEHFLDEGLAERIENVFCDDFDYVYALDFYEQGVPVIGEGLASKDISKAIAKALKAYGIDWSDGEFLCSEYFSNEEFEGSF